MSDNRGLTSEAIMKSKPSDDKCAESKMGGVRTPRHKERVMQEEMQNLLCKLKELVPNMPKNKKLSKLEIIQNVIDYIMDLQIALDSHPSSRSTSTVSTSPSRQPLGVLSQAANAVVNTCAAQEASHTDKVPSHLTELVAVATSRPVSC